MVCVSIRDVHGLQDEAARAMEPLRLTSGNLGRLQQEDSLSQREGTSVGSPAQSPVRMARQALAALDEVLIHLRFGGNDSVLQPCLACHIVTPHHISAVLNACM